MAFKVEGKFNTATVLQSIENVEKSCLLQIQQICDNEIYKDCNIVLMPDLHTGSEGPVGLTIAYDKTKPLRIDPRLVGVDIGCGMSYTVLQYNHKIDGRRNLQSDYMDSYFAYQYGDKLKMKHKEFNTGNSGVEIYSSSMGTLGGGNHFIEISKLFDSYGNYNYCLIVHSGSRKLGKDICDYYTSFLTDEKPYLDGDLVLDYLHDMSLAQKYAFNNRELIINNILKHIHYEFSSPIKSIHHNYFDIDNMIIRKGAVDAREGHQVLIPINMADGSILADGCSTVEFNFSAPHGAGRVWGRNEAFNHFGLKKKGGRVVVDESLEATHTMAQVKERMKDVYTTSLNNSTLDECPFAYKSIDNIVSHLDGIVKNVKILKPVLNIKSSN